MTVRLVTRKNIVEMLLALQAEHPNNISYIYEAPDGRIAVAVARSEREAKREIKAALANKTQG